MSSHEWLCGVVFQDRSWHMSSEVTEKLVDLPIPSELDARGLLKLLAWDVHRSALRLSFWSDDDCQHQLADAGPWLGTASDLLGTAGSRQ